MTTILGVEEAGRGPVIGPLVMAGVLIDQETEENLINIGVKDSKMLTPKQREAMYDRIIRAVKEYKIIIVQPNEIDDAVEDKEGFNLNWLEAQKSAELINLLKPDKAILDCPSTNIEAYSDYVKNHLENPTEIISEHKADERYPVVSAASIIAKVTRDREIERLKQEHDVDFGSGYPSDPKTKEFIEKNYSKYPFFRKSWKTYKNLANNKNQKTLKGF
ncbi:ribonuclease HII [Nanoarchaeota archaeon]